jgi:hypothetical protein
VSARPINRRTLLQGGAAAGAALAWRAGPGATWAAAGSWPDGELGAAQARRVDPNHFLPAHVLERWQRKLDGMGLRAPGNRANEANIDLLARRLDRAGVRELHTERVPIDRWTAHSHSLELLEGPETRQLPTTSPINYCGSTPRQGISAPIAYVEPDTTPPPGSLAGKVALFELPLRLVPNPAFKAIAYEVYDPRNVLADDGTFAQWQPGQSRKTLDALEAAGAVAAVGIVDLPRDAASGGIYPYDGVVRTIPGVFVGRGIGAKLRAAAARGASARVTVRAGSRRGQTRNLLGMIPGRSRELLILNSHTDGPNGIEDNGPNAIVAICQYLTRLPREALPRTILVSLTGAHFHASAGQDEFVARHRDDLIPRTAAALVIEHLGALELRPGENGSTLTSDPAAGLFFAPETSALVNAAARAARRSRTDPTLIARPITDAPAAPDGHGFPAEGNSLWTEAAVPTANFITGPTYLFNAGRSTMDKFDARLMHRQTLALSQMLLDLARVPRAQLRALDLLSG